jgi:ribonuclease P protein component
MEEQSLAKKERLKSKKAIAELFSHSSSFGKNPLRIIWRIESNSAPESLLKVLVAVPKRRVRKAVQRNRIKRLIREVFRLNKSDLVSFLKDEKVEFHLGILYVGGPMVTFETIEACLTELLKRIPLEYEKFTK